MINNNDIKIDFSDLKNTWNKIEKDYKEKYLSSANNENEEKIDFEYLKKYYDKFMHYSIIKEVTRPYILTIQTPPDDETLKLLKEQIENNQLTTIIPDNTKIDIKKIPLKCNMCGEEFEDIWDYPFCSKCRNLYSIIRDQILDKFINKNNENDRRNS